MKSGPASLSANVSECDVRFEIILNATGIAKDKTTINHLENIVIKIL